MRKIIRTATTEEKHGRYTDIANTRERQADTSLFLRSHRIWLRHACGLYSDVILCTTVIAAILEVQGPTVLQKLAAA